MTPAPASVLPHPNKHEIVVVAGGTAYIVDPDTQKVIQSFGGDLHFAAHILALGAVIVGNGLWFECVPAQGAGWRTRRISWEGMRSVRLADDTYLRGEAYSSLDDGWHPFTVNLVNGEVQGGSYDGPPM